MRKEDAYQTIRGVLLGFGYPAENIEQAIKVLSGEMDLSNKPLQTPTQLCRILGISKTTLWRNKLPSVVVGKSKRYSLDEVITELGRRSNNKNGDVNPTTPNKGGKK